jgi:hypothetical protein
MLPLVTLIGLPTPLSQDVAPQFVASSLSPTWMVMICSSVRLGAKLQGVVLMLAKI